MLVNYCLLLLIPSVKIKTKPTTPSTQATVQSIQPILKAFAFARIIPNNNSPIPILNCFDIKFSSLIIETLS